MRVLRDRLLLLRQLRAAGPGPVTALAVLQIGQALIPAAVAVTVAILIGRVQHGRDVWVCLGAFVLIVLAGQLADAFLIPVRGLVSSRVDGAHRTELARLTAASRTIGELEDPTVQNLVRLATADPQFWTEKTPGDGALAVTSVAGRWIGAIGAGIVVAGYAWWLPPVLVIPAMAGRAVERRQFLRIARLWTEGALSSRKLGDWRDRIMTPAEGKEQRVYGFGEWAVRRQIHTIESMFGPLWRLRSEGRLRQMLIIAGMLIPLGLTYTLVARSVAAGHHDRAGNRGAHCRLRRLHRRRRGLRLDGDRELAAGRQGAA